MWQGAEVDLISDLGLSPGPVYLAITFQKSQRLVENKQIKMLLIMEIGIEVVQEFTKFRQIVKLIQGFDMKKCRNRTHNS